MRRLILILLPLTILLFGCTDDDVPSAPRSQPVHIIHFDGLPAEIVAPAGVERKFDFEVSVREGDGNPVSGVEIHFSIPSEIGIISDWTVQTGSSGTTSSSYIVSMPDEGLTVQIKAETELACETASITLVSRPSPHSIDMRIPTPEITVTPGIEAEIEILLSVVDSSGVGVEGVKPSVELAPYSEVSATFGAITDPPFTDESGCSAFSFHNNGKWGRQTIRCWLPYSEGGRGVEDVEREIKVKLTHNNIGSLTLTLDPPYQYIEHSDSVYTVDVLARVVDINRNLLPGVPVDFEAEFGAISGTDTTDELGIARAEFTFIASEDWPNEFENDNQIEVDIAASIAGTNYLQTRKVWINWGIYLPGELILSHTVDFIYADNGLTVDSLTAVLKDGDKQPIVGEEVVFTSTHGTVISPVITDEFGIARSVFKDIGSPSLDELGNFVPATIIAKYNPLSLYASVQCEIRERNPVHSLTLRPDRSTMQAGSGDSTAVRVTAFLQNGASAPGGMIIHWEVDNGRFVHNTTPVEGGFGNSDNIYIAGNAKGRATLQASVMNGYEIIYSNEEIITLKPGPPASLRLRAFPSALITNDPGTFSTITATVTDTVGNSVDEGTLVNFETDLGLLSRTSVTTDENGRAIALLMPAGEAGTATITAIVNSRSLNPIIETTRVTFYSGDANTIQLETDQDEVVVGSFSRINATLYDPNGNEVESTNTVVFQLINEPDEPEGSNFNNHGTIDSAQTSGGVAVVNFNAGTLTGAKQIRAYTWRDSTRRDTVDAFMSILVTGGDPHTIEISYDPRGHDRDGGFWEIDVAAIVKDPQGNPAANRYPVVFTVEPDIASIEAAYTGNPDRDGDTHVGFAFTSMTYNSTNTFDTLDVLAEIQTRNGPIFGSLDDLALPLQQGSITIRVEPERWDFSEDGDTCSIRLLPTLRDGYNILIDDAPIRFNTQFGWLEEVVVPDLVLLRGTANDFLGEVNNRSVVTVGVYVEDYDDVEASTEIIFER